MYNGEYLLTSCSRYKRGSCYVKVQNNIIVDTAPLWSRFIGQPVDNLTNWLVYFEMSELKEDSIGKEP